MASTRTADSSGRVVSPRTASANSLQSLPDDILSHIALALDSTERRRVLPLVSRRWAGLLQGPGPAWAKVVITREDAGSLAMVPWFSRRAGSVRQLWVVNSLYLDSDLPDHVTPRLWRSPGLLGALLMSQAASLRDLVLDLAAVKLSGVDLAVLAALPALEQLTIEVPCGLFDLESWNDQAAEAVKTISKIPGLKKLEIRSAGSSMPDALPTVVQLAALRSPTLREMYWDMSSNSEGTLFVLGALPALVSCVLDWRGHAWGDVLRATPATFSCAPGLTGLFLRDPVGLQLAPSCLSSLSVLAALYLVGCSLTAVPAALSGVGHTLRRLDLSDNLMLQLGPRCFSSLSMLAELRLLSCGLAAVPAGLSGVQGSLRRVNLSKNPGLQLPPDCFSSLSGLEELDISDCSLTAVPSALAGLGRSLQRLDLSGNSPLHLVRSCFSGYSMLQTLTLSDCGLTAVPAALSGAKAALRRLDLSRNPGLQLASCCFSGFSMLEDLSLNACRLKAVPAALSGVRRTLRCLNLSSNYEMKFDEDGLSTLLTLLLLESLAFGGLRHSFGHKCRAAYFVAEWQKLHPGESLPARLV